MRQQAHPSTITVSRGLARFGLAASGAVLAASAWASGLNEPGLAFAAGSGDESWYELAVSADGVRVRAARPQDDGAASQGALVVHVPGTRLVEGLRVNHLFRHAPLRPEAGRDYQLGLGKTSFAFRVDTVAAGMRYVIRYGGAVHEYVLGAPAAATQVLAIADLDGDRLPDFLVEVAGEFYLLLSTHASAGANLPSAQLWAAQ
ncbi:MAG: hypothetical protein V4864_19025 [Pseudomonadota bacterium]